jgi:hypothetical protein
VKQESSAISRGIGNAMKVVASMSRWSNIFQFFTDSL